MPARIDCRFGLVMAMLAGSSLPSRAGDLDLFLSSQGQQGGPSVVLQAEVPSGPGKRVEAAPVGPSAVPPVVGLETSAFRSPEGGSVGTNVDAATLASGGTVAVTPSAPADAGGGCVCAGTPILMADGSFRAIETLQPGDLIAGMNGTVNQIIEVLVGRIGPSRFFSVNGLPPFMTAEQAIMTPEGWKSFDPQLSREGVEFMEFGLLCEGDLIQTHRGLVELTRAEPQPTNPATTIYLPMVSGDRTFSPYGIVAMAAIGPAMAGCVPEAA